MTDVLNVLHVADLWHDQRMRLPSLRDWSKVGRYLRGEWPKPIPPKWAFDGNMTRLQNWVTQAVECASFVAIDTEFVPSTKFLTHIGLGYPEMGDTLLIEWARLPWPVRHVIKAWIALLTEKCDVVFQNAMADVPVIDKAMGIPWEHYQHVDDLMLAHACLWSEWPHSLEFIASMYSSIPKLKHLSDEDMLLYLHGDVVTTIEGWLGMVHEFKGDPRSQHIYTTRMLPLIPIFNRAHDEGIRVDQARAQRALVELEGVCAEASTLAAAWCGYDINVGSPKQVTWWLNDVDGVTCKDVEFETIAGLLMRHPDNDLIRARYQWSQAEGFRKYVAGVANLECEVCGHNHNERHRVARGVAGRRGLLRVLPPEAQQERDVSQESDDSARHDRRRRRRKSAAVDGRAGAVSVSLEQGQHEASVQHRAIGINGCGLDADSVLIPRTTEAAEDTKRLGGMANAAVESRVSGGGVDVCCSCSCRISSVRVRPSFLPTQATGRVSVTDPPLVNFPDDGKADKRGLPHLRDIFIPDPGHFWLCWDWSSMHARFMAAMCGDPVDLAAYQRGDDVHLLTARQIFRKTEVDKRERHLAKTTRYALLNGLDEKAVREAKEVVEQGLDLDELERVAKAFLAAKPDMVRWKWAYADGAIRAGEARSLYGRKRRLVGADRREKAKAAISGFLQMTEVDVMTETLIGVCRRYPECRLVFPSHDGIKLQFPTSYDPARLVADLRPWVEREHDFGGRRLALPAEWEMVDASGGKSPLGGV